MRFDVLTLFPEIFSSFLQQALLGAAIQRGLLDVRVWNIRDWAAGKRRNVDDRPFGGGPGMLMSCPPVFDCVEEVQTSAAQPGLLLMLSPQGRRLDQKFVQELSEQPRVLLLCGRYEGFDERIRQGLQPVEVSVGDFIANGGEVPAMLIIDAVSRLIPGVLGDPESFRQESFGDEMTLEFPQYTRPRSFRGMDVPEVLLNGNHQEIERWRMSESLRLTQERRADLLRPADESAADNDHKQS